MPYVPTREEVRRLRRAVDRASLGEGERVFWLIAFVCLVSMAGTLIGYNLSRVVPAEVTWAGVVGFVFGLLILYWRLRGAFLAGVVEDPEGLHSVDLRTREQRAFTALMLRHALTGTNPLVPRRDHDPFATWRGTPMEGAAREEAERQSV